MNDSYARQCVNVPSEDVAWGISALGQQPTNYLQHGACLSADCLCCQRVELKEDVLSSATAVQGTEARTNSSVYGR